MGHHRVLLADVASLGASAAAPLQRRGTRLSKVHAMGLCVWCERQGDEQFRVEIDDGTGTTLVRLRGEAAALDAQLIAPGRVLRVLGEVCETPQFAAGRSWKRWIEVSSLSVAEDPNAESLHILETLLLYRTVYLLAPPLASPSNASAVSLPLLQIPALDPKESETGVKRKAGAIEPTPTPQPAVMEMTQQLGGPVGSAPKRTVQPAEYQFHVSSTDLKHIESGKKRLEIRLNNPPYSIIRPNDRIKFNGKILGTVTAVRKYAQLRSALEAEELAALLPTATTISINGAVRLMRQFISEAEENNHGVAVFEIQVQGPANSQNAPEEWSKLVYDRVAKAGGVGCTLHDLRFAFPALPVTRIEEILSDLQMDAVVYLADGKYWLL